MSRQRRGGFRPPEIRGTLGTLLRTTLEQASVVRDALERGAREGRSRLDEALSGRRRKDALAELGELVLDLIRRGEVDLAELPEAQDIVRHLDELDASSAEEPDDRIAQAPTRGRFDARSRDRARPLDPVDSDDDGTVSALRGGSPARPGPGPAGSGRSALGSGSGSGRPGSGGARPGSSSGRADRAAPSQAAVPQRVWRPFPVDDEPPSEPREPSAAAARPPVPLPRKGGIQFDDDEDLADYMHPDDVPPKPPADDDR